MNIRSASEKIFSKKNIKIFVISLAIILGIFFRLYNFSNWLHFETDQYDDFYFVSQAVEGGINNLPLLGPLAGGKNLRLGPAFYYMEFLSAKIFGNNPVGHAIFVIFFSIISIPLFFFLLRRFFSFTVSACILFIFSFSFFNIVYSRFSWSPNVLPFLGILFIFSLLKSISEKRGNNDLWFIFSIFVFSLTTQIHFNAFFILSLFLIIFLIFFRPRFKLATWVLSLFVILFIYSPIILSDIKTKGSNLNFFIEKLERDPEEKNRSLRETFSQGTRLNVFQYFFIVTGKDFINFEKKLTGSSFDIFCKKCNNSLIFRLLAYLIFSVSLIFIFIKIRASSIEKEKKNFLIVIFLFFSCSFLYYLSLARNGFYFYPRFFLLVSPIAIIFFGFFLEFILEKIKAGFFIVIIITAIVISHNLFKTNDYFSMFKNSHLYAREVATGDVFPNYARMTLEQQRIISNFIIQKFKENKHPVFIKSKKEEFKPPVWYFLNKAGISYCGELNDEIILGNKLKNGNYFLISTSEKDEKNIENFYINYFKIIETKIVGTFKVFYMQPKVILLEDAIFCQEGNIFPPKDLISKPLIWKDLFMKK